MEPQIKARFTATLLTQMAARYGTSPAALHAHDGFESFIYEFQSGDQSLILRIGHSRRRTINQIHGEVDWINYLHAGGAGVARAVPSAHGRLVEEIPDGHGDAFLATAFVKAPGRHIWQPPEWDVPFFLSYGRLIGRMHALSQRYHVPNPAWRRPEWDDPVNLDLERWLPAEDANIRKQAQALIAYLRALPKDNASYGLIHQDAHAGNFYVDDEGHITLFDFDDCAYGWYAYDLAMVLFYAVTHRPDPAAHAAHFLPHFLAGYRQESEISSFWLAQLPHFMKLRELDLYAIIHRSYDVDAITDSWAAGFMRDRRKKLLAGEPYVDLDYVALGAGV